MYRRILLLSTVALSLTACSPPVSIGESNKSATYQRKISRVLVARVFTNPLVTEKQGNAFIQVDELQQSLTAKWSPLGVTWQVVDIDRTADRKKVTESAIESSGSTEVMELQIKSARIIGSFFRVVDGYVLDASLIDVGEKKRVWRTEVEFKPFASGGRARNGAAGSAVSHQDDANELIDVLTTKLKADGLL